MKNYKFLITVLLILFCASIVATLISCSNTDIIVPPMKQEITNISFKDKTFAYDGKEHSLTIEGTLPAGVNVTYENNNQINVGEYEVTATFIDITGNYEVPEPMTATLTIYNDGSYYSVVFNYEDKQLSYLVKDGELFTDVPQIPSKIGYEGKWDYDFNNPITSDLEVNIKYELIEYNINYILPEGVNNNEKNPSTYNYVSPRIELYSLKDEFGSYFDGWYTTKTFEPESKINYIPTNSTGDITLYAKFINYKIESAAGFEFNYTDYEYPALTMTVNNTQSTIALSRPIEVSEGCSWILSKDIEGLQKIPTKNMSLDIGHNLAYITVWYDDEHNLVYILDIYKLDMFDYKFINENETYVDTTTIQEQTYIDEPTSPIKKGYTFIGWSTDDKGNNIVNFPYQINKNEIFYANYKLNTYKLTYNLNGGSIEGELTQKIPFGSKYELETPTRKGYTFKGYTYNNEPIESGIYVYDTDITIEAQWEANSYNISYYINGKLLYKDSATYDSTYTIKDTIYNYYCKEWVYLDNIIYYPDQEFIFNYDKDISLNGYVVEYSGNDFGCSIINNNTAVKINNYTGNILDLIIPNYIKINNISYRVTSIGSWAFDNCSSLTSITIPEGVTSIGDYAFWGCTSLENVYYNGTIEQWLNIEFNDEDSNPMYYAKHFYMLNDNDEYEEVTNIKIPNTITEIPEGVTSIGDYAFDNCSNLTSISISSRVTSIGDYAFEDCDNLKAVYISDITSWLSIDFYNFKSNPLYYAQNLYLNGELVRNLVIPEGVTSIGDHTFENCSSLRSITLSEGVTSIGDYAFENCSSLTSITLPSTLASIGNHTFENCSSLENVYYNGTIEEWLNIEFNSEYSNPMRSGYNFYMLNENNEYEKVISIKIPNTITVIPNYAFCGFYNITSIEIPEGVTSIGDYAFSNCSNLTSITLPEGVTSIGDYAFSNCSNLRNITLPEGVTSIGKYAFYDCMWLSSITLPKSITSIGTLAFLNDIYLRNVYYNGTIEEWLNIEFERYDSNPMYYAKHFYMLNDNDEYEEVTNIKIPNTITHRKFSI